MEAGNSLGSLHLARGELGCGVGTWAGRPVCSLVPAAYLGRAQPLCLSQASENSGSLTLLWLRRPGLETQRESVMASDTRV